MNNVIIRKIVVTAAYVPLTAKPNEAFSGEISAPPTNAGPVLFLGDDGVDVPWLAGEFHRFERINLADLKIKGVAGDVVTLVGQTGGLG